MVKSSSRTCNILTVCSGHAHHDVFHKKQTTDSQEIQEKREEHHPHRMELVEYAEEPEKRDIEGSGNLDKGNDLLLQDEWTEEINKICFECTWKDKQDKECSSDYKATSDFQEFPMTNFKHQGPLKLRIRHEYTGSLISVRDSVQDMGLVTIFQHHTKPPPLKRGTKKLLTFFVFTLMMMHTMAFSFSCQYSVDTMRRSRSCPMNEDEYTKRSKQMDCENKAQNCTIKSNFKYHCTIDTSGLEFLEVCAPERYILGYCTEFNKGGARIQEHYDFQCTKFTSRPCPSRYLSSDCFKYPECYYPIIEKMSNSIPQTSETITQTSSDQENRTVLSSITVVYAVLILMAAIAFFFVLRIRQKEIFVTLTKIVVVRQ